MNGVGIITPIASFVEFRPISDRICQITTKMNNYCKIIIISAYAPTEESCKKTPNLRENFYNELDSTLKNIKSRDIVIVEGDFNGKTGSAYNLYKTYMGKYGKGEVNTNGYALLELAKSNNLKLTNTFFRHKPAHITTWDSPERIDLLTILKKNLQCLPKVLEHLCKFCLVVRCPPLPLRTMLCCGQKIGMIGRSATLLECWDNNLRNQHCFGGEGVFEPDGYG